MRITAFSTDGFLVAAYPKKGLNGHLGQFIYTNVELCTEPKKDTAILFLGFFFFSMHILFPLSLGSNKSSFKKHIAIKERKV